MADELNRFSGGTPAFEAHLEKKREALRRALRAEYLRKNFKPVDQSKFHGHLFDSAFYRWQAMQATRGQYMYPTMAGFARVAAIVIVPGCFFTYFLIKSRRDRHARFRSGVVAYDDEERLRFQRNL
ncbi:hypothetical protein TCAL_16164 [Tigriopus californicus]|uniref:NADH dehydrogenase [ubiquinone] 1 beta subcomplex subunit 4 n=1 Tax=Tigriopus californicus TaxID=6832 RepID=A0A553P1Q9_TIGCA|nr:uncharacterized protein LOC131884094 [Tigriopus californicus]TRY71625.1 hypothetical protein TCAL_16164 [Tigriopus californicus]